MIVYFDTSAFIPLIIDEPGSNFYERLWNEATRVASVRLLYAEARAALARAYRLKRVTRRQLDVAIELLDGLVAEVDSVEITHSLVRDAGVLAQDQELRGYDAVHLAGALAVSDSDTVFASGDKHLIAAASRLGLTVSRPQEASPPPK